MTDDQIDKWSIAKKKHLTKSNTFIFMVKRIKTMISKLGVEYNFLNLKLDEKYLQYPIDNIIYNGEKLDTLPLR